MDHVAGIRQHIGKLEEYLKNLMVWLRILMVCLIMVSLIGIIVYNFFAPPEKDVSPVVINKLLGTLNGGEFQAILISLNTTVN